MSQPKGAALIKVEPYISAASHSETPDASFEPFVFDGMVSLTGGPEDQRSVHILRDTGGSQSIVLADTLSLR